jgi:hypothetical protein
VPVARIRHGLASGNGAVRAGRTSDHGRLRDVSSPSREHVRAGRPTLRRRIRHMPQELGGRLSIITNTATSPRAHVGTFRRQRIHAAIQGWADTLAIGRQGGSTTTTVGLRHARSTGDLIGSRISGGVRASGITCAWWNVAKKLARPIHCRWPVGGAWATRRTTRSQRQTQRDTDDERGQ